MKWSRSSAVSRLRRQLPRLAARKHDLQRVAAYNVGSATLAQSGMPERVTNASVSWDLFDLLGVKPALGRTFVQDEDVAMKNRVIILSHGMWQRRFGGDRGVIDRTLVLSEVPYTIVGVMPAGFAFPSPEVEYWEPLGLETANAPRGAHYLGVVARIKDGATIEQAHAEIKTITERLARQYPQSKDESAEVVGLHEQIVGKIRPALLTLVGAVGVVVLIACGNVANLLLVRASVRNKEIAIRTALGAGRRRIITQMLAESLVLAFAGGAIGLLLAYGAIGPLQALNAGSIPRIDDVAIDGRRAGVHAAALRRHRHSLRARAGLAGLAPERQRGHQGGRPQLERFARPLAAQRARDGGSRALGRAAGRRGAAAAQLQPPDQRRPGIQRRECADVPRCGCRERPTRKTLRLKRSMRSCSSACERCRAWRPPA